MGVHSWCQILHHLKPDIASLHLLFLNREWKSMFDLSWVAVTMAECISFAKKNPAGRAWHKHLPGSSAFQVYVVWVGEAYLWILHSSSAPGKCLTQDRGCAALLAPSPWLTTCLRNRPGGHSLHRASGTWQSQGLWAMARKQRQHFPNGEESELGQEVFKKKVREELDFPCRADFGEMNNGLHYHLSPQQIQKNIRKKERKKTPALLHPPRDSLGASLPHIQVLEPTWSNGERGYCRSQADSLALHFSPHAPCPPPHSLFCCQHCT